MGKQSTKRTDLRTAVILINMGGPENLDEVRGFIRNLFLDPHIIEKSKIFRSFLAFMISTLRSPRVKKHYQAIGGGSPLKEWTSIQAEKTSRKLSRRNPNMVFKTAYSYSEPRIGEVLAELSTMKFDRIIAFPLYPQYSKATLGSIYSDLAYANRMLKLSGTLITLPPFYEHRGYIDSSVKLLKRGMEEIDTSQPYHVIFTAHALPQKLIEKGDPYGMQVSQTVYLILRRFPIENYTISFQSKIGPVKWMQPSTIGTVQEVARQGIKQMLVMPIGFVCDHIETLYELDIELAGIAKKAGVETFVRADVFNDDEDFIEFMASYIEEHIK
ncbi:MAG TPA: ferrochelatase [candidate division Zixibacteria bacterium]|nr:ferrochelatase [candidate division Zixibacteria bacterium]